MLIKQPVTRKVRVLKKSLSRFTKDKLLIPELMDSNFDYEAVFDKLNKLKSLKEKDGENV